jgi:hypothetical protein
MSIINASPHQKLRHRTDVVRTDNTTILSMMSNILFCHSTLSVYVTAKAMDGVFWLHHQDMLLMVTTKMIADDI